MTIFSIIPNSDTLEVRTEEGGLIRSGRAGRDDAELLQQAVDGMPEGGEIRLRTGRYVLDRPVRINVPVTITGEGRGTEVVPPPGDFAFRIQYDGKCPDRCRSNFDTPKHAPAGKTWDDVRQRAPRLHGVVMRNFAIKGAKSGKGIYLATLTESSFRDLWIMSTYDGAGLYFQEEVMECVFEHIHITNCGSAESKEAALTIRSQVGDACNNLHFRDIYVIFPQYMGIEIGCEGYPSHPRLLWCEQVMVHGWHAMVGPAPYDLVRINKTDAFRGIFFRGCRITNSGPESTYFHARQGLVTLTDSVLGGGRGRRLLYMGEGARLQASRNIFHGTADLAVLMEAEKAEIIFKDNDIDLAADGGFQSRSDFQAVLDLRDVRLSQIKDNRFYLAGHKPVIRLRQPEESSGAAERDADRQVTVSGNMLTGTDGCVCDGEQE